MAGYSLDFKVKQGKHGVSVTNIHMYLPWCQSSSVLTCHIYLTHSTPTRYLSQDQLINLNFKAALWAIIDLFHEASSAIGGCNITCNFAYKESLSIGSSSFCKHFGFSLTPHFKALCKVLVISTKQQWDCFKFTLADAKLFVAPFYCTDAGSCSSFVTVSCLSTDCESIF